MSSAPESAEEFANSLIGVVNMGHEGWKRIVELITARDKQVAEAESERMGKLFNYEGTSGGVARFTLCGVRFDVDVFTDSVGSLGTQRIDALHKMMDALTEPA